MSIHLEDYQDILEELSEQSQAILRAAWQDATRVFNSNGLHNYLIGARSLKNLGRGCEPVIAFLEHAPQIAREIGQDSIPNLIQTGMMMASKTSGAVITLIFATAPIAAKRLGDAQLFEGYLQLLNLLSAQAPRGLRPMLEHLDTLFEHLTLGGLRRWALWGAQAHRTDYPEQVLYFGLESKSSLAMLQQERKGTLFVDIQRRINMYLRALWARDFFMRPTSGDFENRQGYRPYIEHYLIHLPDAYDDHNGMSGLDLYRAAAAHCAAHMAYTRAPISAENLNPLQMAVIALIEDARIEQLAIQDFPGLAQLWRAFHTGDAHAGHSLGDYFNRIARALLDPEFIDPNPIVFQARTLFAERQHQLSDNSLSWDIGVTLAHSLSQLRIPYQPRTDLLSAPYRDDNRYIWEFEAFDFEQAIHAGYDTVQQVRRHVNVMEMVNEIDCELAGDDAQEIWVLNTELYPYEDNGVSYNESEGKEPISDPYHYPEWDYQIQLDRPAWATVLERRAKNGDLAQIDAIIAQHKRTIGRLKFLLDALQPQGVTRLRKLEDGDEIDLNAATEALIDIRRQQQPDPRIMMRSVRKIRDISVLVLLDLSESTNDPVAGQDFSVLQLTREATVLLADAIHKVGDPFAIHGFCSDGRHDVNYYRYKDFDQAYDDKAKAKISGMSGQLSTRMGAAIRHAGYHLQQQKSAKKLLLIITDGEPADIDVRDPQYLRHDAKKAVETVARQGIHTYCMSLDPRADQYVSRIFGARNYMVVDHIMRLPEQLPLIYAGLTK